MARLVHFCFHTPSDPETVLDALLGDPEVWLGGQRVDSDVVLVTLRPAGLLPDPSTSVAVEVTVGPVTADESGVVRRLSYRVEGLVPLVRCDLAVGPTPGRGVGRLAKCSAGSRAKRGVCGSGTGNRRSYGVLFREFALSESRNGFVIA